MCNGVRKSNVSEVKDMFLSHSPEQYQNTWTNPQVHANVFNVLIWWACLLRKLLELKLYLPYLQLYIFYLLCMGWTMRIWPLKPSLLIKQTQVPKNHLVISDFHITGISDQPTCRKISSHALADDIICNVFMSMSCVRTDFFCSKCLLLPCKAKNPKPSPALPTNL